MVPKKCLICCGENFSKKTGTHDANSTSFPSAENFNCQQERNDNGDTELQMVFLLRKLLEIPESTCCLLREHFGKASVWIECCDSCLDLVENCKAALEQAELFQKQYEELLSNIKTTMLKSPKKPFSAESKCEGIVRSHLIIQDIDNFISTHVTETNEDNFRDGTDNIDPNNLPDPVGYSEDTEDSQVLIELRSITPVVIDKVNAIKSEDDIIISFNNVTENFINIPLAEADKEIFPDGNANFDPNNLTAPVEPRDTAEVLTGSITHVRFETISTVKSEEEISLNENEDIDCNLEISDSGNILQSSNTFASEQNNCERIESEKLRKSVIVRLDQFVLPKKPYKCPRGRKSSLKATEEPRVSKRGDKGVVKNKYKCHICLKKFKLPQNLKIHLRSHSSTNKKTVSKRIKNLKYRKKRKADKEHKCDTCDKSFKGSEGLKYHIATLHKGEKPFVCDICGKGFPFARFLKQHSKWHSGEKPFECDDCGKAFITKAILKVHQAAHRHEKPFECDICGKAFLRKAHLKVHQATHSEKRPFKCDICDGCFKRKGALTQHRRSHDEETS